MKRQAFAVLGFACLLALGGTAWAEPPAASGKPDAGAKPKLYDESADVKQQITAAVANARRAHRRVLIQWGGNWCPWCIRLGELMKSDKDIAHTLQYEYDVVHANCGRDGKGVDLAESYGATVKENGFPFLTILDADGKPIANQETGSLEAKSDSDEAAHLKAGHDPHAVLGFLKKYQAAPVSAQSELDGALAEAKRANKRVFLHFGAPWCGWCHKLEAWLDRPQVAQILAKDFVMLKVDTDRNTGGQEMLDKFSSHKSGCIPRFAFLDSAGQPVIDSNGSKGNIGFPGEPVEIEYFGAMLRKGAKNMSEADIAALLASLKVKEQQSSSAKP